MNNSIKRLIMHIPDGYLSPQTYIPLFGAFIAASAVAVRKVKEEVSAREIPYLGMAAAFSFIIMMFNLPIPGGTTGHAVGSALIAIIFGPMGCPGCRICSPDYSGIDIWRRGYNIHRCQLFQYGCLYAFCSLLYI